MTASSNWDGHQSDPAGRLSLPERIVHAVEAAIQGAATDVHEYRHGDWVGGYVADMAKAGAAAVLDVLAEDAKRGSEGHAVMLRYLAQQVVDVPAVEAV